MMQTLLDYLHSPVVWVTAGAVAQWIFSAFVCSMPEPDATSSKNYLWAYRFMHRLAANLDKARVAKIDPVTVDPSKEDK